jgi:hypothetical protein
MDRPICHVTSVQDPWLVFLASLQFSKDGIFVVEPPQWTSLYSEKQSHLIDKMTMSFPFHFVLKMLVTVFLATVSLSTTCHAFSPLMARPTAKSMTTRPDVPSSSSSSSVLLYMSDVDFPSAMPEKPKLTLEQKMEESADFCVETMTNALGEGVEALPELKALKQARADGAGVPQLSLMIYELMIERGMMYDEAPETGTLTLTQFDIKDNLDVKEVKDEFFYLYNYGMKLIGQGLLTTDDVKTAVLERLIKRTGLSPEEFDTWLGF